MPGPRRPASFPACFRRCGALDEASPTNVTTPRWPCGEQPRRHTTIVDHHLPQPFPARSTSSARPWRGRIRGSLLRGDGPAGCGAGDGTGRNDASQRDPRRHAVPGLVAPTRRSRLRLEPRRSRSGRYIGGRPHPPAKPPRRGANQARARGRIIDRLERHGLLNDGVLARVHLTGMTSRVTSRARARPHPMNMKTVGHARSRRSANARARHRRVAADMLEELRFAHFREGEHLGLRRVPGAALLEGGRPWRRRSSGCPSARCHRVCRRSRRVRLHPADAVTARPCGSPDCRRAAATFTASWRPVAGCAGGLP